MNRPKVEIRMKPGVKGTSVKDYDLFIAGNRISQKTMSKALFGGSLNDSLNETIKSFEEATKQAALQPKENSQAQKVVQKEYYVESEDPIIQWSLKVDEKLNFVLLDGEEGPESDFIVDSLIAPTQAEMLVVWQTANELLDNCNKLRYKMAEYTSKRNPGPYTIGEMDGREDLYEYIGSEMKQVPTSFVETEKVVQTILNLTRAQQSRELENNPKLRTIEISQGHLAGLSISYKNKKFSVQNLHKLKPLVQKVVNQLIQHFEIGDLGLVGSQMLIRMNSKK